MKVKTLFILFLLFFTAKFANADQVEQIKSFHSEINIQSNSETEVKESIQYFFPAPKHGIHRVIPVKYTIEKASLTGNYNVYLTLLSVNIQKEDGSLESVPYDQSESGGKINLKIGDPNKEVSGDLTYVIDYKVQRAINFSPKDNEGQDEFYWNVTGSDWEVPIANADAVINFPQDIDANNWKFGCFTGPLGSLQKECQFEATSTRSVAFKSQWELPSGSGLTVLVGFPKNVVKEPTASENFYLILQHNYLIYIFLLIPLVAFIGLFLLWFLKGRDPKGKGTIIPYYAPPDNLSPLEVGTIIDEKADLSDISSVIIDLAVRGYLKIREIDNKPVLGIFKRKIEYEFIALKNSVPVPAVEKSIYEIIFRAGEDRVKMTELQDRFPQKISDIKSETYTGLVQKGYFPKNPERVRNTYLFLGAVVAFLGIILFANDMGVIGAGSMFLTGALIAIFGLFMPRKTIKGVDALEKILGLKEYLSVAEKDRIQFHNAPAKRPELFEKLLPYAMVLKVEQEWAKQFEGIYNAPPSWYEGTSAANFNAIYFASSLNNFSYTANAAMGVKTEGAGAAGGLSGFGGGGFSGGGFGGGGGGSW